MPRIFLVDAFRDEREMYAGFFALRGHDVAVFDAPEAALEAARRSPPDAIVTRIPHPGRVDATALTALVRGDTRTQQVALLVITSYPLSIGDEAQIGCDTCILLPATPDALLCEITAAVRSRGALRYDAGRS